MNVQSNQRSQTVSDWIPIAELATLTGRRPKSLYNDHSAGRGPFAAILTKLGGRLGVWRADYEALKAQERRLPVQGRDHPEALSASIGTAR